MKRSAFEIMIAIAVMVLAMGPANATTVINGTSTGNEISFYDLTGANIGVGKTKVSLDINGGNFISGQASLITLHSYSIYYSQPPYAPDIDYGNDDYYAGSCSFGFGPIACDDGFGGSNPILLTDFLVGPTHMQFVVEQPASYNNCGNVFDTICMERWTPQHSIYATVTSPVSYKISYASLNAVPEPSSWSMMIAGFGMVGGLTRKRKRLHVGRPAFAI